MKNREAVSALGIKAISYEAPPAGTPAWDAQASDIRHFLAIIDAHTQG
jgi:hypothetical protein